MNTPLRFLTLRSQGDDVSHLHGGLLELGWAIAPDELSGAFYGPTTRIAVAEFQRQRALPLTGSFDEVADRLMAHELAERPKRCRVPTSRGRRRVATSWRWRGAARRGRPVQAA